MTTTVIAMYDHADKARQVINAIVQTGISRNDVDLLGGGSESGGAIIAKLTQHGLEQDEAAIYADAIQSGAAMVALKVSDEEAERMQGIMEQHGARDLQELALATRNDAVESVPVVEEQVSIGKRRVLRGGYRVTTSVVERPVEETVQLREEKVEIDRQRADRKLSPEEAELAFKQKTVEVAATREEAVISKEARVVEEINLHKTVEQREEELSATARRTEVKVEKVEAEKRDANRRVTVE